MSLYEGISQVQVGYGQNTRNRAVRKWTEEQTDLFAAVLSLKHCRNGEEISWSEELENLAVKKSSNEHVFKEVQEQLEVELVKVDQSHRDPGEEATFSIPQLRAKYKWMKREWKAVKNKIKCGLLREDTKLPKWYKRLNHIFTIYVDMDRDEKDIRPSMVSENGSIHNEGCSVDETSDGCPATPERSWVVNIDTRQPSVFVNSETAEINSKDEEELANGSTELTQEEHDQPSEQHTNKRPYTAIADDITTSANAKYRKRDMHGRTVNTRELPNYSMECCRPSCRCSSQSDSGRFVEVIKSILDAEERRERMFVDFQREQAQLNRQHELKIAQIFVDMSSQQRNILSEISSIKELILSKGKQF
ncbi:uncharacterized protein LOC110238760 [Exaiptasia diaphana]|uniref:Uncharacterized protein n=1 Tax=Exaiptasia diaphana TaxID=2652724 RepID=A0A913X8K8_EXADI|nr:uncharacterized protein LOC110238760 [Exaiptasia diaphana]KXJ14536.1 hypothetical protein AC249_AIPGENE26773 [Exaiptasia diaphana]